jgi:hypothetical protein
VAASGAVSATTVSIQHEINTCTRNAGALLEDTDTLTGSHALTRALADTTSVFMPQMFAQHAAFAVLAVWPKLSVFTSSALALRTAFEAVRGRCFTEL